MKKFDKNQSLMRNTLSVMLLAGAVVSLAACESSNGNSGGGNAGGNPGGGITGSGGISGSGSDGGQGIGGGDNQAPPEFDPSDSDSVARNLIVRVGGRDGTIGTGPIPEQSAMGPRVDVDQAPVAARNGSTVQVPVTIDSDSALATLLLRIVGSDNLISIDLLNDGQSQALATQRAAFVSNGMPSERAIETFNVEVTLPPGIREGSFEYQVAAIDVDGNVSNAPTRSVVISRVGTGRLQFSLSWDAPADLDLHVTEPGGNEIFFANRGPSASGGQLDFDNTSGIDAVENIFWDDMAPNGTYIVRVNYFSGGNAANFVVTASADGQIIEAISRGNFVESNGCVRVYTFNYGGDAASSSGVISPGLSPDPTDRCS